MDLWSASRKGPQKYLLRLLLEYNVIVVLAHLHISDISMFTTVTHCIDATYATKFTIMLCRTSSHSSLLHNISI